MNESEIVTHKTIANALKIAKSTVSLALSNNPRLPSATRAKVHKMAEQLGYRANPLLSDLARLRWKSKKSSTVGVAFIVEARKPGVGGFEAASVGVLRQAESLGYKIEYFYREDYRSSGSLQRVLIARGIRNLIIGGIFQERYSLDFDWDKFVAVAFPVGLIRLPLHAVVGNHYNNVVMAWSKAVEYGYRRIGAILLSHNKRIVDDDLRLAAVLNCQKQLSPNLPIIPYIEENFSKSFVEPKFSHRLAAWINKHRIDVVIGFHGGLHYHLRKLVTRPLGFINLHLPMHSDGSETPAQAGVEDVNEYAGAEVVNLLHMCRKTNQWGAPTRRVEHVVDASWRDGRTLPFLCSPHGDAAIAQDSKL